MLDLQHLPNRFQADVQIFTGHSTSVGATWVPWHKPRGKSMLDIVLIGKGGNGGTGVIGAVSTAAGGGGGGSGGQTLLSMPLHLLPDILYLSLAGQSATTTLASYISIAPSLVAGGGVPVANNTLMVANGGGNGGAASGATAGIAGTAAAVATLAVMPLGWAWATLSLAGQAGIAGGTTGAGAALTLPVTGLRVTGGTGGGGLGAANSGGSSGGPYTVAGVFPPQAGGVGSVSSSEVGFAGHGGYAPIPNLLYHYGGTGSGSGWGSAVANITQPMGGNGYFGCGGGGNGGYITGTTAAASTGQGGAAICIITCW